MGHRHTKDDLLAEALATALDVGLSQLSFGRVAERAGTSDRMVVYYFPTKDDLLSEVLVAVGLHLQQVLGGVIPAAGSDHRGLAAAAWPALARPAVDPYLALFFEANGLAAAGREPFRTLVPQLVDLWIEWLAGFVEGTPARRRAEGAAAIALVDGLLLLRHLAGPRVAQRAAASLGIV